MPAYAPMLEVTYYAQNYAGIIRQWLTLMPRHSMSKKYKLLKSYLPSSSFCYLYIDGLPLQTTRVNNLVKISLKTQILPTYY